MGGETPMPETQDGGGERGDTFFISKQELGDYKPGDTVQMRIVGEDKDGNYEMECLHDQGKGPDGWKTDLREHMAAKAGGEEGEM